MFTEAIDRFDGEMFCLNDYICYSADVKDLTQWKYEGVIFRKDQDPRNQNPTETEPIRKIYNVKSRFGNGLNPSRNPCSLGAGRGEGAGWKILFILLSGFPSGNRALRFAIRLREAMNSWAL